MQFVLATVQFEDVVEVFCFHCKFEAIECMEELQEKDPQIRYKVYVGLEKNSPKLKKIKSEK